MTFPNLNKPHPAFFLVKRIDYVIEARKLSQLENTPYTLLAKMIKSCKKQKTISKELLPVVKEMEVNIVENLIYLLKIHLIKNTEKQ